MRPNPLFWVAGLAVVVCAMAASARQGEEKTAKEGVEATYRNESMRFNLEGKTGKLYYKCAVCGKWHAKDLTLVKQTTFKWKGGDTFTGWVYKARGENRWYFLSDDTVDAELGGKTVKRYPIASSTTSSSKKFNRIKTAGGTTRDIFTAVTVDVTDPENNAKEAEIEKDEGEEVPPK